MAAAQAALVAAQTGQMADEYGTMNSDGEKMVIESFYLDSGRILENVEVCYMTWGEPNEKRDNIVVVCHALTGNANLESWWKELLGKARPLDTSKYCIFCSNVLGGCYGTTGPSSLNPATGKIYGSQFPKVTIRDMVRIQAAVLEQLKITEVACVVGGSMGGMQALEWALEVRSLKVRSFVSISATGRHQPWQIGISECQRQAIYSDPKWNGGSYDQKDPPKTGMSLARMMAMVTYRTHPAYKTKFGRALVSTHQQQVFDVENYLYQQGQKFNLRKFDPWTYVRLTQAMDSHDVERGRGSYHSVLQSITIPTMIISISSDVLYPVSDQAELAEHIKTAQHHIVQSDEGHDGFILETRKVGMLLRGFLAEQRSAALEQVVGESPAKRSKMEVIASSKS